MAANTRRSRRPRARGWLAGCCIGALLLASPSAAAPRDPPLVRAFPSFSRVPRVPLVTNPTPLQPLRELERRVRAEAGAGGSPDPWLWIKRDDVADGLVGGNKARKLDYMLGEARARGARAVLTSGRYGTNLGLTTAAAARRMDIAATVVLAPAPVSEAVLRKLLALHASGAQMRFHSTLAGAILDIAWLRLQAMLRPETGTYYIPPSGTSDVGSIGCVNAFFELLEQTGEDGLPDEIVIAAATGGTAAGLLAGICLSGQWDRTRVRAVAVTDGWLQSEWLLRREARETFRRVRDALDPSDRGRAAECDFDSPSALTYVRGYLAPGYGLTDPALEGVMRLLRDTQGVELDPTYTATAMRHFLDRARERLRSGDTKRRLLFWNTYAPVDLEAAIREHPWSDPSAPWRDLPAELHPLFGEARQ